MAGRSARKRAARAKPPVVKAEAPPPPPPVARKRRWLPVALAGTVAIAAVGVWIATHRHAHAGQAPADAAPVAVVADAGPKKKIEPPPPRPPQKFVGAARCGDCHEKEKARWEKSWHFRAMSPAKAPYVVGNYNNAHFAGSSSEAWMKRAGNGFAMRAHGVDGELADFPVGWVIGGKRMQDDVAVFPDGRWQVLPVYFHVTTHEWVDYTENKQGALTPDHPFYWTNIRRMANHECLDCHTTGLRVEYDESAHQWKTTFSDGTVSCEDCHGAGGVHAESEEKADIVHPAHAGEVGVSACIRCHGPRKPLWPLLDPEHQFRIGDNYDELYEPIVVTIGSDRSPDFFVDGKPKTSSFEYQALLQSQCYRKGKANCLTCHTAPHEAVGRAELRDKDPDASCKKCHAAETTAGAQHTHHKAAAAQRCIACHMAPIVSGVLDQFADHSIDVPVPQNTAKHGVPNACGVCHADKPVDQLTTALTGWWPQAGARAARRERLADAFDDATATTSQRPLLEIIADEDEAPTLRGAALVVLGARFGAGSARAIAPLLRHKNLILRAKAAEALAAAKARQAADALVPLLDDPSLRVRQTAALALRDLRDERSEAALHALADDPATTRLMVPHLELAQIAAGRHDFTTARKELTTVVRLAPYHVDALVELAALSAEQGDFAEAKARNAQALALEPHHKGAVELQGKLDLVK
jgi:HEAT repeat protein/cytochrome c554/c'-like protein